MKRIISFILVAFAILTFGSREVASQVESYKGFMVIGNSHMANSQWAEAISVFERARKAKDAPADLSVVDSKIAECRRQIAKIKAEEEEKAKSERKAAAQKRRRMREEKEKSQSTANPELASEKSDTGEASIVTTPSSFNLLIFSCEIINFDKDQKVISSTEDGPIKATDVRWLTPVVMYSNNGGSVSDEYELSVKIFDNDGDLRRIDKRNSIPEGYSCNTKLCLDGEDARATLIFSWGNDEKSIFDSGNYRIELWYRSELVYSYNFNLL